MLIETTTPTPLPAPQMRVSALLVATDVPDAIVAESALRILEAHAWPADLDSVVAECMARDAELIRRALTA